MSAQDAPGRALQLQAGRWEGEYIDAYGHRAKLRLDLSVEGDTVRGTYEVTLRTEDAPQVIRGQVEGRVEGDQVRLRLPMPSDKAQREAGYAQYEARLRPAGSYAQQAMFGTVSEVPQANLGGGVWIAWRFARPEPKER